MRPLIWICAGLYLLAMAGVSFAARHIVNDLGIAAGLVTIAAIYAGACYIERRS